MPLRSSHGLFSRQTYFCFKYIHDCLWTRESKLIFIRPSEINRAWKCKKLLFVRARSSCDLDSGSEPKEVSSYLSCLVEFEDRLKREELISSNSSSSERGNRSLSVSFDLRLPSKGVYIKKSISSYGTLLSHSFFQTNLLKLRCSDGTFLWLKRRVHRSGDNFGLMAGELIRAMLVDMTTMILMRSSEHTGRRSCDGAFGRI
jgi:hypothetical protein